MRFDPRLVVPGSLLGCMVIIMIGLAVTAGFSLPASALAAGPGGTGSDASLPAGLSQYSAAGLVVSPPVAETVDAVSPGECSLSARFPASILQWCDVITHYANKRGLQPDLVAALIWQESGGNALAFSKSGAVGLMQVMPSDGLAANFMCPAGPCFADRPTIEELQDPEYNIAYGTRFLAGLLSRSGDIREALKSYGPMDVGYYYADKVLGIFQTYGNAN